jgi:hypothetical protein
MDLKSRYPHAWGSLEPKGKATKGPGSPLAPVRGEPRYVIRLITEQAARRQASLYEIRHTTVYRQQRKHSSSWSTEPLSFRLWP